MAVTSAAMLLLLLAGCVQLVSCDEEASALLTAAIRRGDADAAVQLLLGNRGGGGGGAADPNLSHPFSLETPLHLVARGQNLAPVDSSRLVKVLAGEAGADVEARNRLGETPLFAAAAEGNPAAAKALLEVGADPLARRNDGRTPVWAAVFHSRRQEEEEEEGGGGGDGARAVAIQVLLRSVASRLGQFLRQDGGPVLLAAAARGHEAVVRKLMKNKVPVDVRDERLGKTPLIMAAENNRTKVVEYLLGQDADPNASDLRRWTPLLYAVDGVNLGMTKLLISNGANVSALGSFNKPYRNVKGTGVTTPLLMASLSGEIDIVRHLIDSGADVFWTDDLNQNGLHKASVFDHPDIFELLIEAGADLYQPDDQGETPVNTAARYNSPKVLEVVLSHGHSFSDVTNRKGGTVLHDAAFRRATDVVRFVLSAIPRDQARILSGQRDKAGFVPFHLACVSGDATSARLLLGAGPPSQLDVASADGQTPLMIAVSNKRKELVDLLLEGGADVDAATGYGGTSLHFAAHRSLVDVVRALLEAGADAGAADDLGKTPLHAAAARSAAVSGALLWAGADPRAEAAHRVTPLHLAARAGRADVVRLLLAYGADADGKSEGGRFDGFSARDFALDKGHEDVAALLP